MTIKGQRFAGKKNNLPAKDDTTSLVPATIAENDAKLALYNFIVEDMKARNLFSPTYTLVIDSTVNIAYHLHNARKAVEAEGMKVPRYNSKGDEIGEMANPSFHQMLQLETQLMKLVEKLGMSPRDIVFLERSDKSADEALADAKNDDGTNIVYFR